ncbi:low-density lipoprotein receptor-related protein 4-like [Cylas formicarius]|uniref:low-density lipoprotein receptor-related protein 4-like n=1 Tax=Cylas formicarius TaxID=197179 RepID=UPI00295879BF|nr:low-density lipoprotein receptor-related protein 4-like [Cylas formicarius]
MLKVVTDFRGGVLWILAIFILFFAYVKCSPEYQANSTSAVHPGAARQMFGSGSLRPAGAKTVLATGHKRFGVKTTLRPYFQSHVPILPIPIVYPPWPIYPGEQLPFFIDLQRQKIDNSKGEARKKYSGKSDPRRPYVFPFDLIPPGKSDERSEKQCKERCEKNFFQCYKTCTCIRYENRCDGHMDCDDNEDELACENHIVKCNTTIDFILCPRTKRCISRKWLCDGDDDCGDFSDETRCGFASNCSKDQFQCDNGLCIPKSWICDNDNDCRDFSDEMNCTKIGCTPDEFECGDTTCISLSWKCDRHIDCTDGSDERDCDIVPPHCNDNEFQCNNHKCIKFEFKCDGDDDCDDWSDEDDCPKVIGECVSDEFKCKSGKCIPRRFVCDNQKDCDDNEDEVNCDYSKNKTCSSDEFTCPGGDCILKTWVCDGLDDCPKGEDEQNCEIVCDESKFPCTGPGRNDTSTSFCIGLKHRCDGIPDCPKGEDERNCSKTRDCERNTKCKQLCITTANGQKSCSCLNGYRLAQDGYSCDDIDECLYATDPVCSQTCNNTIGSFKCGCMTGYILRPDLRTCKAVGAPPTLLFANRIDIRQMSLSNTKYTQILKGLHNAISLDYHYKKRLIFWSDVSMDRIKRAFINGTQIETVVSSGLESPGGIALDWIHDLLFWTDSGTKRVEVSNLDGTQRAIIAASELDKPRAIVVHPGKALVFWTDWGPNPKIERAEMDGSNRKSLITESVFWPNGLTIDFTSNQIYWADAKHNVIETAELDGSKRKKVITKGLPHPFAITIFEDAIFWTDWHTKSICSANKITGAGFRTLHSHLHFPMDIHSYHPQRQPSFRNRCGSDNGGCAHICLPNKRSYTCVCKLGQKLKSDKKSCQKPERFLLFARKKDLRIKHLDDWNKDQYQMVIPIEGVKAATAVAWDSKNNFIYFSDVATSTINRAFWNGSHHQVIVRTNLATPSGLAVDWVTNKLYWTDESTSRIEIANSNGEMRSLLIWENLDKPKDITVDPQSGLMFWSDWGEKKRIERANMDGSGRMIIIQKNLSFPNGLTVDHQAGKLYWTDGALRIIASANFDGSARQIILEGSTIPYPFGLDVFGDDMFWTDWESKTIEKADKVTGGNRTVLVRNLNDLMGITVFHRSRKSVRTPCTVNNGGCSHLCLLKSKGYTCACPTGIKLGDDHKSCASGPINYILLAHRMDIRQISLDVPYMVDVVLPFKHLKLATSVDVDRKTGEIYWTDTSADCIQRATPDGKNVQVVISNEIEAPDGIVVDSTGRKIYWTDGERNSIEVAELDGKNRKLLFHRDLDNPRAITLHYHHGLMFWSDWGKQAKIEVAHMDGTNRTTLISADLAWPNGLAIDRPNGRLYWNDGKLNVIESSDLNGKDRRTVMKGIPHPYGLVVVGNHIYWTDWKTQALHRADKYTGNDNIVVKGKLEGLMDVRSVQSDNIAENACGTDNGGCSHLCLRNPHSYTCACPTGLAISKTNEKQCEPIPSTFLLLATRYSLSQISLDTLDAWDVTLPIVDEMSNVIDIDYHWDKKLLFYTDIERNVIQSVSMLNMSDVKTVARNNLSAPDGLAVDWIANNIYWTNTGNKIIEVARLDGSSRKTVIKDYLHDPRSIVIHPKRGYLYWTDWFIPKIERSHLDGSSRRRLVDSDLSFPIGLVLDFVGRRLYWIDARLNAEKIETTDFHGKNRIALPVQTTHPFSLTQFEEHLYWTDWDTKSVLRAEKTTGKDQILIRSQLHAAMGITMVTKERQLSWNPCAVDNGGCTHLCFYRQKGYTCGCPDEPTSNCKRTPVKVISMTCPPKLFDCSNEDDDYDDEMLLNHYETHETDDTAESNVDTHTLTFYIMTVVPMLFFIILSIAVIFYLLTKKGKKNYMYGTSRSFSNPNYYSANNEANTAANNIDRKQFIWKRLKYDKSQERVYEETVGPGSPEITSLIPTILTPCSSNCETVTPEMERSPSVTPLHKTDVIPPL